MDGQVACFAALAVFIVSPTRGDFPSGFPPRPTQYYESEHPGLCDAGFIDAVKRATARIASVPSTEVLSWPGTRRIILSRSPCGVYREKAEVLLVGAVANLRQRPGHWHHTPLTQLTLGRSIARAGESAESK